MSIGWTQILLILLLVLVLFGAGKLPRVMGDLGKGLKSFKRGLNDLDDDASDNKSSESASDFKADPKKNPRISDMRNEADKSSLDDKKDNNKMNM